MIPTEMSAQCSSKKILGVKAGSEQNLVKKKKVDFNFQLKKKVTVGSNEASHEKRLSITVGRVMHSHFQQPVT